MATCVAQGPPSESTAALVFEVGVELQVGVARWDCRFGWPAMRGRAAGVRALRTGEELRAVSEAGVGFVFNDIDKRRKMLHATTRRCLSEASVPPAKLWFADLHEAEAASRGEVGI